MNRERTSCSTSTERNATSRELTLEQVATSVAWTLPFFTRRALRAACTSRGWHVESRWPRDRRAFGRRVTGDGLSVETAPGAPVTEAVDDPKAPVAPPSDVVVVNHRTTASRAITADSNTGYDPCAACAPTAPLK